MLLINLIGNDRTIVCFLFLFLFVCYRFSQKLHIFLFVSAFFLAFREDCTFWNVVPDSAFTSFRMFQCKCTPDTQPKTVSRMLYSLIFTHYSLLLLLFSFCIRIRIRIHICFCTRIRQRLLA